MHKITAILVDDEISSLKGLEKKIEKLFPEIEILCTFQKPEDAIKQLKKEQPDILFLDIQMPRITGFELLSALKDIRFQVVFVTAYNEYAIDAFKQSAIAYILKPIENEELISAVNKATTIIKQKKHHFNNEKLLRFLTKNNRIMIPSSTGISFVPEKEVIHVEGYDGYTKIHLTNTIVITSSYNLGKFEKQLLSNTSFFKCHKSHIINLEKVTSFENEGYIILENEHRVPISKTNKKAFFNLFD